MECRQTSASVRTNPPFVPRINTRAYNVLGFALFRKSYRRLFGCKSLGPDTRDSSFLTLHSREDGSTTFKISPLLGKAVKVWSTCSILKRIDLIVLKLTLFRSLTPAPVPKVVDKFVRRQQ